MTDEPQPERWRVAFAEWQKEIESKGFRIELTPSGKAFRVKYNEEVVGVKHGVSVGGFWRAATDVENYDTTITLIKNKGQSETKEETKTRLFQRLTVKVKEKGFFLKILESGINFKIYFENSNKSFVKYKFDQNGIQNALCFINNARPVSQVVLEEITEVEEIELPDPEPKHFVRKPELRCETRKRCFETLEAAEKAALSLTRKNIRVLHKLIGRAYKCDRCEYFHLTSQEFDPQKHKD